MTYRPFQFTAAQAMIVAKWEVGVRNLLAPVGMLPYAIPLALEALRIWTSLPLPQIRLTTATIAAACIYALLLLYVVYRLYTVADKLKKRNLAVSFDGDTLVVKEGEDAVYVARFEDILRVDYGAEVMRAQTPYGAGCVPRERTPASFLTDMHTALGGQCRKRRWM